MYHRPAAFAHGGTDELTHHLGHTRVHLGLNMAATAVPIASEEAGDNAHTTSEDVVLYFGIIDILQVSCHQPHRIYAGLYACMKGPVFTSVIAEWADGFGEAATAVVCCRSTTCPSDLSIVSSLSAMMVAPFQQSTLGLMPTASRIS